MSTIRTLIEASKFLPETDQARQLLNNAIGDTLRLESQERIAKDRIDANLKINADNLAEENRQFQLAQQAADRRFAEQQRERRLADRQAQLNFEEQFALRKEQIAFEKSTQARKDEQDQVQNIITGMENMNDLLAKKKRLKNFAENTTRFSPSSIAELNNAASLIDDQIESNRATSDFLFKSGAITEKDNMLLSRVVNSANFNTYASDLYKIGTENLSQERKQEFQRFKIQYEENEKTKRALQKELARGMDIPGFDKQRVEDELKAVNDQQENLLSQLGAEPKDDGSKKIIEDLQRQIEAIKNTLPKKVDTNLLKELIELPTDASTDQTSQIFAKYGITDLNEQAEIITRMQQYDELFEGRNPFPMTDRERREVERRREIQSISDNPPIPRGFPFDQQANLGAIGDLINRAVSASQQLRNRNN